VIPVARKVWQPIGAAMPAATARRRIMRQASGGAEQPTLAVLGDAGRIDVGAQRLGKRVMARHRMLLAAFLMQPDRPPGAARPQILDLHLQGRIDAREAVGEGGDQCPVAQIAQCRGWYGIEQFAPFGAQSPCEDVIFYLERSPRSTL